jgi:hypothetical protein
MKTWMWFVLIAVVSWGAYVPMVHKGAQAFRAGKESGSFRAFLFVGLAYFLMAGAILLYLSVSKAEPLVMTSKGMTTSTIAGILGAAGALGVIFATSRYGGSPLVVAPLVFAGAPIVNTFVSMIMHRPETAPKPMFYVGLLLAAAGAAIVLRFRPT